MRNGRWTAMGWFVLVACTSVCTFAPEAGAEEGAPMGSVQAEALMVGDYLSYFNIPPLLGKASYTIMEKLLAYINGATPGSEIRGHITYISLPEITQALKNAHRRGVQVFLVQDGEDVKNPPAEKSEGQKLEDYFGTRHKDCYMDQPPPEPIPEDCEDPAVCSDSTSCVSSYPFATHHIKNWLFSNTVVDGVTRTYSTWVTSYNLTETSNKMFNDVFIVNDNLELYNAYEKSYRHFYGQDRSDDFYNVPGYGHHVIASANTEISYSPNKTSDHVAMALSRIDGYEPGCSLQVAVLSISSSRTAVIKELRRIRALGCQVQVAATTFHAEAMSQLLSAQVELRHAKEPKYVTIHSKMMLYKGTYDGTPNRTFVWGGSHN